MKKCKSSRLDCKAKMRHFLWCKNVKILQKAKKGQKTISNKHQSKSRKKNENLIIFSYKRRCYPSNEVSDLESALGKIKNLAPASLVGLLVVDKMVPGKSTQGQFSKVIFSFHRYLFRNSNQSTQSLRRNKIARRDSTSNRH